MLVIHGIWAYGALQVWAEDSALPAQAPPRAGRPSRAPRPHPFAAPPDVLADVLAEALTDATSGAGTGDLPRKAVDDEITLSLPSRAGWRVPVLVFEPAAAAPLLSALAELPPGEVVASGSIGYLAAIVRFAGDLASRGRVLPALIAEEGGYAARWRPVLSAVDARHARELAAAMPPACRAVTA